MTHTRLWIQRTAALATCFAAACDSATNADELDPDRSERRRRGSEAGMRSEPSATVRADASRAERDDPERIVIPFLASVEGQRLECGTRYDGIGVARSTIELRDFRFYVHDVQLIDADGKVTPVTLDDEGTFQMRYQKPDGSEGGLALLDFATHDSELCSERGTEATHGYLAGRAPVGHYERLAFTIGVPTELNHIDGSVAQAPLNAYGMQWSWASGYRHMKLDVKASTDGKVNENYYFHPGATGCRSDSGEFTGKYTCDNSMTVRVEIPFARGREAVEADVARLYANSDLSSGRGCMGTSTLGDELDPSIKPQTGCAQIWETLGLRLPSSLATRPETRGRCEGAATSCRTHEDCASGVTCAGYVGRRSSAALKQRCRDDCVKTPQLLADRLC